MLRHPASPGDVWLSARFAIDAGFPGGNIVVERVKGDDVFVRQDLGDTKGWWFYWCFRVRGAAGRTLAFHFTDGDVFGARGPAVSRDKGATWEWLGRRRVRGQTFRYSFGPAESDVRFGFGMAYTETHLRAFLKTLRRSAHLKLDTLCTTRKGRRVERLRFGRLDGRAPRRVLLTCRHHACEMMANYALEGLIAFVLRDPHEGRRLRDTVEFAAVPFVDKDGVEDGDQGKNRLPYDHNRDYLGRSRYPSVRALRAFAAEWFRGRCGFALDMHCPWMRGGLNERIYFVGMDSTDNWRELTRFSKILRGVSTGPLPYHPKNNLPFGQGWNTAENRNGRRSCKEWAATLPDVALATSIEIPYANASGKPVTAESARALGRDLARALLVYLDSVMNQLAPRRRK